MEDRQAVAREIDTLIERKWEHVRSLQAKIAVGDLPYIEVQRLRIMAGNVAAGIDALVELQHILRLCGCPPEAYAQEGQVESETKTGEPT